MERLKKEEYLIYEEWADESQIMYNHTNARWALRFAKHYNNKLEAENKELKEKMERVEHYISIGWPRIEVINYIKD